jgi:hypothetical protein
VISCIKLCKPIRHSQDVSTFSATAVNGDLIDLCYLSFLHFQNLNLVMSIGENT